MPLKKLIAAAFGALALLGALSIAQAQDKPIKIALIASKTGPSEAYARDTERGLRLGLEYLTQGSMTVLGRKTLEALRELGYVKLGAVRPKL